MNKNLPAKLFFVAFLVAISFWKLYPTIELYTTSVEDVAKKEAVDPEYYNDVIKLGLDLKGGVRFVYELEKSEWGKDLLPEEKIEKEKNLIDQALKIIRNRVDQYGVSEPVILKEGNDRIIIELPGITDIERAKKLIGSTAMLEFRLVREADIVGPTLEAIDNFLRREGKNIGLVSDVDASNKEALPVSKSLTESTQEADDAKVKDLFSSSSDKAEKTNKTDSSVVDSEKATTEEDANATIALEKPFSALLVGLGNDIGALDKNYARVNAILNDSAVKAIMPIDVEFVWDSRTIGEGKDKARRLYLLKKTPELTGDYIEDANPSTSSGMNNGAAIVNMSLNNDGAKKFAFITKGNLKKRLAIVLDNRVFTAPTIQSKIPDGRAEISGMADFKEANDLSIVLRAGALPVPLVPIEERVVGASLGRDSIEKGGLALVVAFMIVIFIMVFYYKGSGLIATMALLLNLIFLFALLAGLGLTLTLPGIAGIILTLGMAVDANVIIFERIKEELRTGKTVKAAIDSGYGRAFSTIFDANVTTLITAVILDYYGTGPIKGFAITLIFGILSSMFTAIWVTRLVFNGLVVNRNLKKLSI